MKVLSRVGAGWRKWLKSLITMFLRLCTKLKELGNTLRGWPLEASNWLYYMKDQPGGQLDAELEIRQVRMRPVCCLILPRAGFTCYPVIALTFGYP